MCHDFTPGGHLDWGPENPHRLYYDCVTVDLLDVADRILCLSAPVRSRLLAYAGKCGRDASAARVIAPGRDPLAVTAGVAVPREITGRRFALSVGPIVQCNNLGTLVRTWEALFDHPEFDLDLVLVGRAGEFDEAAMRTCAPAQPTRISRKPGA
jgi:hypothetical protein